MAKINNISLKSVKKFTGHEGECVQGNLYLGTKKIGFWSQDGNGGPDIIHLDKEYSEIKLEKAIHTYNFEKDRTFERKDGSTFTIEYGIEKLMTDLIDLIEDEKIYKKGLKKGYDTLVILTDGFHYTSINIPEVLSSLSDKELLSNLKDDIVNIKSNFLKENEFTKHEIRIYRTLNDFEIGEKINLKDIKVSS